MMQNTNALQRIFLVLFVVSTVVVLVLAISLNRLTATAHPSSTDVPSVAPGTEIPEVDPSTEPAKTASTSALIGSVIASATSLVGFLMTTVITWRKEKRESALADVERRKLETELEKSRLELESMKKTSSKKKTKK